jgi:hypothetical protein
LLDVTKILTGLISETDCDQRAYRLSRRRSAS